jgi:hypothetical protein
MSLGGGTTASQSNRRTNSNMKLLDPIDVVEKKLIGSDDSGTYSFLLNQDGTFLYTVNEEIYNGKWTFDRNQKMYRYTFDWTEDDKKRGYIMDFLADGPEITLAGHWYLTDAYMPFGKKLSFEN